MLYNIKIRIKRRIKFESIKTILFFKRFNIEKSIIIFSEPRGGSTWLMELLNNIPNSIINWEPLHVKKGVIPKSFKWGHRVFIPVENENGVYVRLIESVLTLKKKSKWTLSKNSLTDILVGRIIITKFVQGNMLLPWITSKINFVYKPIYLIRHPISTSLSQIKAFGNAGPLEKFVLPKSINNHRFIKHLDYINSLKTLIQRQVALWCINNLYVLNIKNNDIKWLIMYYEDLVLEPEKEIKIILKKYELEKLFNYFDLKKIRKRSATDFNEDLNIDPRKQVEKFKEEIEESELDDIQEIFDHFNIKCYSAYSAYPIKINN